MSGQINFSPTGWRPLAATSKAARGEYGHEVGRLGGNLFFMNARSPPHGAGAGFLGPKLFGAGLKFIATPPGLPANWVRVPASALAFKIRPMHPHPPTPHAPHINVSCFWILRFSRLCTFALLGATPALFTSSFLCFWWPFSRSVRPRLLRSKSYQRLVFLPHGSIVAAHIAAGFTAPTARECSARLFSQSTPEPSARRF